DYYCSAWDRSLKIVLF
nr:immunoglobulin light chain junction region [Macaca mulatta]